MKWISVLLIAGFLYSCATPTTPTGGPRDEEGPEIVETDPETGTTDFEGRSVTFNFNEFVDRESLPQAINIEPDLDIEYSLDWGRKSVAIEFEEELPELTTVIITLETDVSDVNGNNMSSSHRVAVSTGPDIDEGKLTGTVLDAQTGEGYEDGYILLYRTPVDLSQRANYSTSLDTSGTFEFSYLRQGDYKAFWVDDRNRNKQWDRDQELAQPFPEEYVLLEEAAEEELGQIYISNPDTTRPRLQGVGLFSSQRLRMRFNEDISISDTTTITVLDTLGNNYTKAWPLYVEPEEEYILFARSDESLDEEETFTVKSQGITDQAGNSLDSVDVTFSGSAEEDTTRQRIIGQNREYLYPSESLQIIYATNIEDNAITDSLQVIEDDEMIENWEFFEINRNRLDIQPDEEWRSETDYEIRVWDPLRERHRSIEPTVWGNDDLGELNIQLEDTTLTDTLYLTVISEERGTVTDTSFSESIEITDLPPLNYRVVVYRDDNDNGQWDPGQVEPFEAPEPYVIERDVPVESGFTGDLSISFPN